MSSFSSSELETELELEEALLPVVVSKEVVSSRVSPSPSEELSVMRSWDLAGVFLGLIGGFVAAAAAGFFLGCGGIVGGLWGLIVGGGFGVEESCQEEKFGATGSAVASRFGSGGEWW